MDLVHREQMPEQQSTVGAGRVAQRDRAPNVIVRDEPGKGTGHRVDRGAHAVYSLVVPRPVTIAQEDLLHAEAIDDLEELEWRNAQPARLAAERDHHHV